MPDHLGMGQQQRRDVGQRTGGDQRHRLVGRQENPAHQLDRAGRLSLHCGLAERRPVQPGLTVDIRRGPQLAVRRPGPAAATGTDVIPPRYRSGGR